ncbi:hypothetical protein M595_5248, partial [Lyngbya aestuarii BL J]
MGIFPEQRIWFSTLQEVRTIQVVTFSSIQGESSNELAH